MARRIPVGWHLLWPVVLGYSAGAVAFGAVASALHLNPWMTIAFSVLLYSGALQSVVLGLVALGPSLGILLSMAFVINLRHMLYGPHLETRRSASTVDRLLVAGLLTDELYALGLDPSFDARTWRVAAVTLWSVWIGGTALGIGFAGLMPEAWLQILTLALPALFVGLLVPRLHLPNQWVAALTAGAIAVLLRVLHAGEALYAIPIVAGTFAAYWRRGEKLS